MADMAKSTTFRRDLMHVIIAAIIGLLIGFVIPPGNGLTQEGLTLLAIFVPTVYMWVTLNTTWVSLLFLALLPATRIVTPGQMWSSSLGHFAVTLILVFVLLDSCLQETGAIKKMSNWFITRKFIQGRPYAFMAMFFASNLFIGIFMQNMALMVMYLALTVNVCENLGLKKGDSLYTCLMLGTLWGNCVLSVASPIAKSIPNVVIGLVYSNLGVRITYAQWFALGIPFMILMLAIIMIVVRIINPDVTALKNFNINEFKKDDKPLGLRGKIALYAMLVLILIILLPELILFFGAGGTLAAIARYFVQISVTVPAIIIVAALSFIRVREDGQSKSVMNFAEAAKSVPVSLLLFIAVVVSVGGPLGAESAGIVAWLGNVFEPVATALSPFWLAAVMVVVAIIATQVLSNTVIATMFFLMGTALLAGAGTINPAAFGIIAAFASCIAFILPPSFVGAALYYGGDHIHPKQVFKYNLITIVLAMILISALIPLAGTVVRP